MGARILIYPKTITHRSWHTSHTLV